MKWSIQFVVPNLTPRLHLNGLLSASQQSRHIFSIFVLCLSLYSVLSRYSSNMYIATDVNHLFIYAGNSLVMAIFTDILP